MSAPVKKRKRKRQLGWIVTWRKVPMLQNDLHEWSRLDAWPEAVYRAKSLRRAGVQGVCLSRVVKEFK